MTTSARPFRAFGFSMERQRTRRRLVVITYLVLATICGVTVDLTQRYSWAFAYALYAAIAVGIFVFGGQGRYGLIKSFLNKPPRQEPAVVDLVRLQLDPMSIAVDDASSWKNDERELARRDAAHYIAYQPLVIGFFVILLLASWAIRLPPWGSLQVVLHLILTVALVASVLAITLPSAIILWREPDLLENS